MEALSSTPRRGQQAQPRQLIGTPCTPLLPAGPRRAFVTPSTPSRLEACFVCGNSPSGHLRNLFPNAALPEAGPLVLAFRKSFDIDLVEYMENLPRNVKICDSCKKKLTAASKFREDVQRALGQPQLHSDSFLDSLGCNVLTPSPRIARPSLPYSEQSSKRPKPSDFTPTPIKHTAKKGRSDAKCALAFTHGSDHHYSRSAPPAESVAALVSDSSFQMLAKSCDSLFVSTDRVGIQEALGKGVSDKVLAQVVMSCSSVMTAIEAAVISDIHRTCDLLCSLNQEPGPSVLRSKANAKAMQKEDVLSLGAVELHRCMPLAFNILTALCKPPHVEKSYTQHAVGMMYAIAMHNRNNQLSAVQKINTAVAVRHHANNDLLAIFHKLGVTLAAGSKLAFLDQMGTFNTDGLIQSLHQHKPGKITMDNIDGLLIANQVRKGSGNQHYHYAASTYYPDRCDVSHLTMVPPRLPEVIGHRVFFLTNEEEKALKQNYGYQIGRLLVHFCPELKWMDGCIPKHIPHEHSDAMAVKSEVFPLKIILEDPKYYTGCIRIIEDLIDLMRSSYEKAGRLDDFQREFIPLGGDQLVRVRSTGAGDLRAGAHTRDERLEPLFPEITEFFHVMQDFLEKMVKALYVPNSARDRGSLPYFKAELERTNVNGQVKGKFQAHEDFVQTVGSGLLLRLAMDKMDMQQLDDKPNIPGMPDNIARMQVHNRQDIFDQMMGQIVDEVYEPFQPPGPPQPIQLQYHVPGRGNVRFQVLADELQRLEEISVHFPGVCDPVVVVDAESLEKDELKNYSLQLLQWYIQLLEFQDAIKEGDIFRCNICLKMMIPFFYGHSPRSKYVVECLDYILKTEVLLPPALALRCRLASFVNPHGGAGSNKPADMQQENNILVLKDVIRGLGAGKTDKAIVRASLAAPVIDAISEQYKKLLGVHLHDGHHVNKSYDDDVRYVVTLANGLDPFAYFPGREMPHYKRVRKSAYARLDKRKFMQHLAVIVNRLRRGQNVDMDLFDV